MSRINKRNTSIVYAGNIDLQKFEIIQPMSSSYTIETNNEQITLNIEDTTMKTYTIITSVGIVWFGVIYSLVFSQVTTLLSTVA